MEIEPAQGQRPQIVIGVSGHRELCTDFALSERVLQGLQEVRERFLENGGHVVVLSALAEGADRLVANLALHLQPKGHLHVVLPFEMTEYQKDIQSKASLEEFCNLLSQAESIGLASTLKSENVRSPYQHGKQDTYEQRNAAYEFCGRHIVDNCDMLLALWDGKFARGRGGTAEIVAYSREKRKPLVWILSRSPYKITYEGFDRLPVRYEKQEEYGCIIQNR